MSFTKDVWSCWCKCTNILKLLHRQNSFTSVRPDLQTPSFPALSCFPSPPSSTAFSQAVSSAGACSSLSELCQALSSRGTRGFKWGFYEESSDRAERSAQTPQSRRRKRWSLMLARGSSLVQGWHQSNELFAAFYNTLQSTNHVQNSGCWSKRKKGTSVFPLLQAWNQEGSHPIHFAMEGVKGWLPCSRSAPVLLSWSTRRSLTRDKQSKSCYI